MESTKSLKECGIETDELIYLGRGDTTRNVTRSPASSTADSADADKIERVRELILSDANIRTQLQQVNALLLGKPFDFV